MGSGHFTPVVPSIFLTGRWLFVTVVESTTVILFVLMPVGQHYLVRLNNFIVCHFTTSCTYKFWSAAPRQSHRRGTSRSLYKFGRLHYLRHYLWEWVLYIVCKTYNFFECNSRTRVDICNLGTVRVEFYAFCHLK